MKKTIKRPKVDTGTVGAFFKKSLDRARKLDRGEKLPAELRLTFEDPADLLRVLTAASGPEEACRPRQSMSAVRGGADLARTSRLGRT